MRKPAQHKFQAPKGTRDFYPPDMAVRRHVESVWRQVSINHGFEEIDGPMFEHTDLYTVKSGPGIVSEIFGVFSGKDEAELVELKKTGRAPYALQPEFTPTLARMYAARAGSLPKPTKWFSIRPFFRAERPQRGRLREFLQWNVDIIGDESASNDAEAIAVVVNALHRASLQPNDVKVHISDRYILEHCLAEDGVQTDLQPRCFDLIDKKDKMELATVTQQAKELGISDDTLRTFLFEAAQTPLDDIISPNSSIDNDYLSYAREHLRPLAEAIKQFDLIEWCVFDLGIVRGLAYYTGTVFEVIAEGERAVAGGGRYDKLIELFGGPPTPACGFAMGDVVLTNLLRDKGLLKPDDEYLPRPDAFMIAATDEGAAELLKLVAQLRRDGFHVRHSYKTTRNVGKLLTEASKARARFAMILGKELAENKIALKNLDSGEQREVLLTELANELHATTAHTP